MLSLCPPLFPCALRYGTGLNRTQVQQQKKQQRSSDAADHTKVVFDISREALEKLMLYHQHSFAEAMAGLDEALNIYVEFFWKDLVFPMQSPILFRKLDMKRRIRAALADAAKDVAGEIERFTRKWSVQDKPGMSTEDARKLVNMDFVESTLGGVVVRYVAHGNKGDTSNEVRPYTAMCWLCFDLFPMVAVGHRHVLLVRKCRYIFETVTAPSHRYTIHLWSRPVPSHPANYLFPHSPGAFLFQIFPH